MIIERLNKTGSTNDYIERYVKTRTSRVVSADEQTNGKGTKGRSFLSEKGGLYASFLRFYDFFPAADSFKIMMNYSVAVVKTLRAFGINAGIKWPNDIIANNKKICGILIKNVFCGEFVDYTIAGIGLNVNNPIDDGIKSTAVSMKEILGQDQSVDSVFFTLIKNAEEDATAEEYSAYSIVIGKKVTVIRGDDRYQAVATAVLPDGRLQLEGGEILSAAELDLKIRTE